jgi:hypothetical protein
VKRHLATILAIGLGLAPVAIAAHADEAAKAETHATLVNAEPSIDALVERLRTALVQNDKTALRALRLTQDEYLGIVLPGSVPPGQPWATYSDEAQQYFWGLLNGKSIYSEANLLHEFGGRPIKFTEVHYRKGVQDYANYRAYKQLVLTVEDDAGTRETMRIGSIAEIGGQFKFVSYVYD